MESGKGGNSGFSQGSDEPKPTNTMSDEQRDSIKKQLIAILTERPGLKEGEYFTTEQLHQYVPLGLTIRFTESLLVDLRRTKDVLCGHQMSGGPVVWKLVQQ